MGKLVKYSQIHKFSWISFFLEVFLKTFVIVLFLKKLSFLYFLNVFHFLQLFTNKQTNFGLWHFTIKLDTFSSYSAALYKQTSEMESFYFILPWLPFTNKQTTTFVFPLSAGGAPMRYFRLARPIELLWVEIPPQEDINYGLESSVMVLIKGGTEFILYGGSTHTYLDNIWKYCML